MKMNSIWKNYSPLTTYPLFKGNAHTDVVVIGGGITGLTTTALLIKEGFNVMLLEAKTIFGSNTAQSTGNLYVTTDKYFSEIEHMYGMKVVKDIIQARTEAMTIIENNVSKYSIECDYEKVPWHLYSATKDLDSQIDREFTLMTKAGLNIKKGPMTELPYPVQSGIILEDQAQFHPLKYGQGLVRGICDRCRIYENSPVVEINERRDHTIVFTPFGKIMTRYLVHATHTPKGVMGVHTLLGAYREYGIAAKVKSTDHPKGIFWGLYDDKNSISTRPYEMDGEKYMIVVGAPHKVGQEKSSKEKIDFLENFARSYFDVLEVSYAWGGQHYRPADLLPYIGRTHHETTLAATGFSTDGLIWGNAAAKIIVNEIMGVACPYAKTFSYSRFNPVKSAKNFVKENFNVLEQYLKDLPGKKDVGTYDEIKIDEGKIVEKDGQKLAVHRDAELNLHVCSAICTHLECIVHWNDAEKSWDCPCHGSRFGINGDILEGPATQNLDSIVIEGNHVTLRESPWISPPQSS